MNVRQRLNWSKIRKILHSRMKLRKVYRKAYWLEFENESILSFLTKYNIVMSRQESSLNIPRDAKVQDYVNIDNQPEIIIDIVEL